MPGVYIGDGAIIGANSTVASDVDAYSIAAGNPARKIKMRFDVEMIELLEKFKWWDKDINTINRLIPLLSSNDVDALKTTIKSLI